MLFLVLPYRGDPQRFRFSNGVYSVWLDDGAVLFSTLLELRNQLQSSRLPTRHYRCEYLMYVHNLRYWLCTGVQGGQAQLEQNKVVGSRDPWIAKRQPPTHSWSSPNASSSDCPCSHDWRWAAWPVRSRQSSPTLNHGIIRTLKIALPHHLCPSVYRNTYTY